MTSQHGVNSNPQSSTPPPTTNTDIRSILGYAFGPAQYAKLSEKGLNRAEEAINQLINKAVQDYREKITTQGRPLSAPPLVIKQPVPCTGCKAPEYYDWTLLPHQAYNSFIPGGVGHYCFPCFAKLVMGLK